jgi:multicomponent Na+:H+ antiporter subunit C
MILYMLCFILFCVGLYAVFTKRNLVKIIIGIVIAKYAVNLFLALAGCRPGQPAEPMAQAVTLVSIVTGLGVTVLLAAIAMRLHEKYGTFDVSEIRRLKG